MINSCRPRATEASRTDGLLYGERGTVHGVRLTEYARWKRAVRIRLAVLLKLGDISEAVALVCDGADLPSSLL